MRRTIVTATLLMASGAAFAADQEIQFDFQGIDIQAQNASGVNSAFGGQLHTGFLNVTGGGMLGATLDVTEDRSGLPTAELGLGEMNDFMFTLSIELLEGIVTGGDLTLTSGSDIYTASLIPGAAIREGLRGGAPFSLSAATDQGVFSNDTFAGLDVSSFDLAGGVDGLFRAFEYRPNASGFDGQADLEVIAFVPSPGTLSLLAAGGLIVARRRRA